MLFVLVFLFLFYVLFRFVCYEIESSEWGSDEWMNERHRVPIMFTSTQHQQQTATLSCTQCGMNNCVVWGDGGGGGGGCGLVGIGTCRAPRTCPCTITHTHIHRYIQRTECIDSYRTFPHKTSTKTEQSRPTYTHKHSGKTLNRFVFRERVSVCFWHFTLIEILVIKQERFPV